MKYTIKFYFPLGEAFPIIGGGFDSKITDETRCWNSPDIAKIFAEDMCGKYDYEIVEIAE